MIRENALARFSSWRRWMHQRLRWFDGQSQGWASLLVGSLRDVLSFQSSLYAAALAYFTLFSVFPLILLSAAIASQWLDPATYGSQIIERLEFAVPALSDLMGANLERIVEARGAVTRLSVLALLWSASSVFYMLTRAMDATWEEETARPAWRHRALAIVLTLGISTLLWIASIVWSIGVPIVNSILPERLISISPYLGTLAAAIVSVLLLLLLYYVLPHSRLQLRDVAVGAVLAGLLWELAKRGFLLFVTNFLSASNLVYGSVTTIIALLTWAYLTGLIFLFGAHVNVRYKKLRQKRQSEGLER
jgi:membrane protein